jgi:hypothetical protein
VTNDTPSEPKNKLTPPADIEEFATFQRSPKYRVRIVARQREGSRFVALVGEMLAKQGIWLGARTFNVPMQEIDELVNALERAKERLS